MYYIYAKVKGQTTGVLSYRVDSGHTLCVKLPYPPSHPACSMVKYSTVIIVANVKLRNNT